jgi:hypothetical protein
MKPSFVRLLLPKPKRRLQPMQNADGCAGDIRFSFCMVAVDAPVAEKADPFWANRRQLGSNTKTGRVENSTALGTDLAPPNLPPRPFAYAPPHRAPTGRLQGECRPLIPEPRTLRLDHLTEQKSSVFSAV